MNPDTAFSRRRVLVVEDEVLVAWVLSDMLAGFGCTVIGPAGRVQQALEIIASEPIDAAVLDVNLNGEFSYPIADALIACNVPFVFSTGYDRDRLRDGYRGYPHLQKPFLQSDLTRAVAALLTPALAAGASPQPASHEQRL
jgi:CheY-like chemotaxis protein